MKITGLRQVVKSGERARKGAKGRARDSLYDDARHGLSVLPTCDEAVKWANELIASIAKA